MRRFVPAIFIVLMMAAMVLPAFAAGDVSRCHVIADPDARNYCRAKAMGNPALCATIQDSGLRALCQAEVR
jgi:hypothetical protein